MSNKDSTYGVKHKGKVIGEIPKTGNTKADSAAALQILKDKGLYVPTTPFQAMFRQAQSFCTTASYLYKKDLQAQPINQHSIVPFVVNAAFAIEVYLKALSLVHSHKLHGHKLLELFDKLPPKATAEIEAQSADAAAGHKVESGRSFRDCLHAVNNAFVDWRYLYEKESADEIRINEVIFLLDALHHACSAHDPLMP